MTDASVTLILNGEQATQNLGKTLAARLKPGAILLLEGDLGAGKTSLARAIIRALMANATMDVPSPSFALVQPYENDTLTIVHADLYRLSDESELDELGLTENEKAIVLVEWPERAPSLMARADLRIQLKLIEKGRARQACLTRQSERLDLSGLEHA